MPTAFHRGMGGRGYVCRALRDARAKSACASAQLRFRRAIKEARNYLHQLWLGRMSPTPMILQPCELWGQRSCCQVHMILLRQSFIAVMIFALLAFFAHYSAGTTSRNILGTQYCSLSDCSCVNQANLVRIVSTLRDRSNLVISG